MADSVVSFLLENLSRLLTDEVNLLSGVKGKVKSLENELKFIAIFLKSSEGKRNDDFVKEVVSQIRDVAYEAEDAVDTYVASVTKYSSRNMLGKLFHCIPHGIMLHDVNDEIDKIKGKIKKIYENKDTYGIVEGDVNSGDTEESAVSCRQWRENVEEEEVVGFVHDSSVVIEHLKETDPRLNVVSIIGMGGLGKTTLARKIYNNHEVQVMFPCRAWGSVSNDYRARELLLSLLKCLSDAKELKEYLDLIDEEQLKKYQDLRDEEAQKRYQDLINEKLKEKMRECLRGKKYLVVLDDIWESETWDQLKDAFPDDHKSGSRILITSRTNGVAGATFAYNLPLLNEQESWKLFSKKAFPREECPSGIEDLSIFIFKGCGGLPLAIIVLAGIVAKKDKSQRERWLRSIKDNVNWHLAQDNNKIYDILKLSYDSLPRRLKPCFLYLGIYPEDYEIPVRQLILLWVAEGFIQPPQESGIPNAPEPEDIADGYLDELVDRSLVQVGSRRSDGGVKTCRIHDLLRDICISESKAEQFLEVCTKSNVDSLSNPRRLSLHCKPQFYHSSNKSNQSWTRSLLSFSGTEYYPNDMLENFKLARVVNLEGFFQSDKRALRYLKMMNHIRYLKINVNIHFSIDDFGACILSLWNLQTLDVRDIIRVGSLPSRICKLKRLRHLYLTYAARSFPRLRCLYTPYAATRLPANLKMQNLQTLCWVIFDSRTASLLENGSFPNLKKLGLYRFDEQIRSLHQINNLRTLKIFSHFALSLDPKVFPSNLTKITLIQFNFLISIDMNALRQITSLQILILRDGNIAGDSFDFYDGDFPQLRVFQIIEVEVQRWRLEDGAMPHLRRLVIHSCRRLSELPKKLWSLTALQEVHVLHPSQQLANHLQLVEVKNGCKLTIVTSENFK